MPAISTRLTHLWFVVLLLLFPSASYIEDLNANITQLPSLAPYSKYDLPEEKIKGRLEFKWIGEVTWDRDLAANLPSKPVIPL